ncbi:hypothetical protein EDB89DRAFT_1909148 [Lactarius sanguifluus]|nr:hypothetical protein EDB89DRAFT_1909148 [Lactarius sanguifluus]
MTSSNFRLIRDALKDYHGETGINLQLNPFTDKLKDCDSAKAVFDLLQSQVKEFKEYREGNRRLINWLRPVVEVVHTLSDVIGEAVSLAPFPPAKAIFVGINVLLAAASGVSSSYDALVDLFECIGHFLNRLHIYTGLSLSSSMKDIIVRIMVEVLSALALARKQIKDGRFSK